MRGTQTSLEFHPHQRPAYVFENPPRPGELYRYPGHEKVFVVESVGRCSVRFECGHWCTDNVFADMIRVPTSADLGSFELSLFDQGVTNGNQ